MISVETHSTELKEIYARDGILVFDPGIEPNLIENVVLETKRLYEAKPEADRFQDAWKTNAPIKALATHPRMIRLLRALYGKKPLPFQTLSFRVGTEQAIHSDTIHFNSYPAGDMCGVWFALEDVDMENGPLIYYLKSHRLPELTMQDIGQEPLAENYKHYEVYIQKMIDEHSLPPSWGVIKKGSCVIWAANLLHGGYTRKDRQRTRLSQVTHYFFEGSDYYYTPMLSSPGAPHLREPEWIPYG